MKRKLLAFSMTLALVLSVFLVANVGAHPITIEMNNPPPLDPTPKRTDWFGVQPDTGQGAIMRNKAQQGEFVFNDATKDQRQIVATKEVTRAADLDWFSVTADKDNIYFLAKVERYNGITQSPAIELMITIDTDHVSSTDPVKTQLPLGDNTVQQTNVPSDAAWEYTVDTKFQPGPGGPNTPAYVTGSTDIWTNGTGTQISTPCPGTTCKSQLAAAKIQGNFAEIAVPWSSVGGVPVAGANFRRFTVATLYSNRAIPTLNNDTYNSPVIDVLGIIPNSDTQTGTLREIEDGQLDTSFDVHFDTNPAPIVPTYEPYAPLLVSEFQPNPLGNDAPITSTGNPTESEWIEIYNPNTFAVTLSDYKIGNAAKRSTTGTPSNTQGMFRFKSGSIDAKSTIIVAKFKQRFLAGHPTFPSSQVYDLSSTNDFTKYTTWSNGTAITLDNGISSSSTATTFEEQVLLLDAKDDIVDLVNYGNPTTPTPGNIPIFTSAVLEDPPQSFERCPAGLDTNGGFDTQNPALNNADFIVHDGLAAQTPGVACEGRPGVDVEIVKTANVINGTTGDPVVFTLSYDNIGKSADPAGTATVIDTLPAGLTFVSASVAPSSQVGQTLTWNVAAPAPGSPATVIQVTTTIDAGLGENHPMTNQASISSPNEPNTVAVRSNNTSQATVTTIGPAQLELNFGGLGNSTPPGKSFGFTLNYANTGQNDASDTTITLDIPANVTLMSADAPGATANFTTPINGPTSLTWSITNLPSNTQGTITFVGQVAGGAAVGTQLTFSAQASSEVAVPPVTAPVTGIQTVDFNKIYIPTIHK